MGSTSTSHTTRKNARTRQSFSDHGDLRAGHHGLAPLPDAHVQPMVDIGRLLRDVCQALVSSATHTGRVDRFLTRIDDGLVLSHCASSLALIVSEAVINAIKHAHPTGVPGAIGVDCKRDTDSALLVEVADDGVGLPEGFDPTSDGGFGFRVMRAQSEQLGATLTFESTSLGLRMQLRVPPKACGVGLPPVTNGQDGISHAGPSKQGNGETGDTAVGATMQGAVTEDRRFRKLLQALPAAVYTTDAAGRITFYNDAAVMLWGCQPELGKAEFCGSWKLYWPDGTPMPHDECPMALALREKRPIRGMEAIAERPDGVRVPFIPYPSPLYDDAGVLTGAVNMLVDITERRQAEEASHWLAAIVDSSDDAIISKDLDGIFTSWNRGAERVFGYTGDEVIGKSVKILIPAERHNEELAILERLRRGERIEQYETVRLRKDGSLVPISLSVSPVKVAGKIRGASKIARDITERKQAEARQALLTGELHHRTKNLFAVVHAVVSRSFVGKRTVKDAEVAVLNRLHSLAQTHVMLSEKEWQGADIAEVVRSEMNPYGERVIIEGPNIMLTSQAAQNFALALHELATNAAKYGALSNLTGHVRISWSIFKPNGHRLFTFRWQERGGPRVTPPKQKGFGSAVLEQVMAEYFETPPRIDYAEGGVIYELNGSIEAITGQA
jgi:PAS domain S-box-containing protein